MACFVVPAAEAIVTTIAVKLMEKHENTSASVQISGEHGSVETVKALPFSRKLKWLSNLLWGGSLLLAFEHVWHGEVTPWAPFLTATANPADTLTMLHEIATTGVSMAVLVTAVWGVMVLVTSAIEKRAEQPQAAARQG